MNLVDVRVEIPGNTPIVLLQEQQGDERMLPIFIGQNEAQAIALALQEVETPRPMTHDLVRDLLMVLGSTLTKVVVTDLRDKTFFAELYLSGPNGDQVLSCRPSDGLALAARTGADVFAEAHVIDQAGFVPEPAEEASEADAAEMLDEFRDFIDSVNPEDFGG